MKLDGSTLAAILAAVAAVAGWLEAREQRLAGDSERQEANRLYADRETAWAEVTALLNQCKSREER